MGEILGVSIIFYLLLLFLSPPLSAATLGLAIRRQPGWRPNCFLRVIFTLINPLLYLLVIKPQQYVGEGGAHVLAVLSWIALGVYCLAGAAPWRWRRLSAAFALVVIASNAIVDFSYYFSVFFRNETPVAQTQVGIYWLFVAAFLLYCAAAAVVVRKTQASGFSPASRRRVLGTAGFIAVGVVTTILSGISPTDRATRDFLKQRQNKIVAAAHAAKIDPVIVAAVAYQAHRASGQVMRRWLENTITEAWLVDDKSHYLLSTAFDFSIGFAQIKPVTAQTALMIFARSQFRPGTHSGYGWYVPAPFKEYRDVPRLEGAEWNLTPSDTSALTAPSADTIGKKQIVGRLLDDETNLSYCAFLLGIYAAQWEHANPAWSIRQRPEILATLYQLGFERSRPKPNPQPNAFGTKVAALVKDPEFAAMF